MHRSTLPVLVILWVAPAAWPAPPSLDGRIFLDSDILGVSVQRSPSAATGPLSDDESHDIPGMGGISASFDLIDWKPLGQDILSFR